ncbi:glycosyltransferase [Maribacter sp. R77961]|uniref:glycosyltransferase n=1 Tax=Maribacter sp. R77961 TaxID=3093871 RepID=UPI0037CBB909
MSTKKIAILIVSMEGGGAERVVAYLSDYLVKQEHEVHLFLLNNAISYEIPDGVTLHLLSESKEFGSGFKKLMLLPFQAIKYGRLLNSLNISHSLSFLTRPNYINVLAKWLSKGNFLTVLNERSYPSMHYADNSLQSKLNKRLIKWLYPKGKKIIGNSYGNHDDLIENFNIPKEKMQVIQNPVDLAKINAITPKKAFFDKSYFNIITVGRLDAGKNHQMLINAMALLNEKNSRLYILGSGGLKSKLEALITALELNDRVFLMGFDSNPYQFIKEADLFIFGSNHEGFPNVLLEAMACGKAIISTNCKAGPSEIMKLTEEKKSDIMKTDYGILTPIDNAHFMAKAIELMITNTSYKKSCEKNVLVRVKDFEKDKILSLFYKAIEN